MLALTWYISLANVDPGDWDTPRPVDAGRLDLPARLAALAAAIGRVAPPEPNPLRVADGRRRIEAAAARRRRRLAQAASSNA